jgi:hypothetical protein
MFAADGVPGVFAHFGLHRSLSAPLFLPLPTMPPAPGRECPAAYGVRVPTAVISDIHGNAEALKRVLEDIEARQIDRVVCLGDTVGYGPTPLNA